MTAGALKNSFNKPPLREVEAFMDAAASGNNAAVLKFLDEFPGAIEEKAHYGKTALMKAAGFGRTDTVRVLLEKGASPDAKDREGWTALHHAAVCNDDGSIVKLLLEAGATIDKKNRVGKTALMLAAQKKGSEGIIAVLLRHGADIALRDNQDYSATAYALRHQHADACRLLNDEHKTRELAAEMADFSAALKHPIPAPRVLKTKGISA